MPSISSLFSCFIPGNTPQMCSSKATWKFLSLYFFSCSSISCIAHQEYSACSIFHAVFCMFALLLPSHLFIFSANVALSLTPSNSLVSTPYILLRYLHIFSRIAPKLSFCLFVLGIFSARLVSIRFSISFFLSFDCTFEIPKYQISRRECCFSVNFINS